MSERLNEQTPPTKHSRSSICLSVIIALYEYYVSSIRHCHCWHEMEMV